jgi:hypothetical protein
VKLAAIGTKAGCPFTGKKADGSSGFDLLLRSAIE